MDENILSPEEFENYAAPQKQTGARMMSPEQFEAYSSGSGEEQQSRPRTMTPDEFDNYVGTSTRSGVAARGLAEGILPGLAGAGAGWFAGGLAAAPFTGGWSIPAGLIGGGIAGLVAAMGVDQAQDYLMEKAGLREGEGLFSRTQQATDEAQYPYTRFGAQMVPGLAGSAVGKGAQLGARAIGGAMGGGLTAAVDALQTGEVDPGKVAMGVGAGALFPGANPLGRRVMQSGEAATGRFRGGNRPVQGPPEMQGPQRGPLEGEVATPPTHEADITFAQQQRDGFTQGDPMWTFWDEHLQNLQSRAGGKGDAQTVDASQGPHGDQNEFTYHETNRANDLTTVAKGVAAENAPAPRIQEAGNPVGAPMLARDAARTNDPVRDYRKLKGPEMAPEGMRESTPLSTAPIHEDVVAALTHDQEPAPTTRLYRGETDIPNGRPMPDWLAQSPEVQATKDASGRWFTNDRGAAQHYNQVHGDKTGRISHVDVPSHEVEQYRASNHPEAKKFVAQGREGEEFFLPRELANKRQRMPVIHEDLTSPYRPQPETPTPEVRLAPKDQHKVDATRQALEQHGMKQAIESLDRLPQQQQVEAAERIKALLEAHGKAEYDKSNRPTLSTGVQGRSKADAARKGGALEAIERAIAKFGGSGQSEHVPTSVADRQALVERLQAMWDHAVELNNGVNPIDRKTGYAPREKTPAWTALNAARRVLDQKGGAGTPATIRDYFSAEKNLREGKPGEGNVFQETERIEADIAKRPHITNQAALDAIQAKAHAEDTGPERYPELDRLLRPVRLKPEGDESLNTRPSQVELVPAENVKGKPQQVKTPADVAKFEGRRIDPNSAEGKAIAAAALKASPKQTMRETKEQFAARLDKEKAIAANPENLDTAAVTDGSDRTALEHWARMMGSESGSLNPGKIGQDLSDWMKTSGKAITNFWHPRVPQEILDYGKQIGMGGVRLGTRLTQIQQHILAHVRTAVHPDGSVPSKDEFSEMRRAFEDRNMGSLSAKDKAYFNNYVQPLRDQRSDAYRDFREISQQLGFPGADKLPEQIDNGQGYKQFMSRRLRQTEDESPFNPLSIPGLRRSLGNWTASGQPRNWMGLQNDLGDRRIYRINDDGNMVFYKDGKAGRAQTPPASFEPWQVGSELHTSDGRTWKVDNAGLDELIQHGRGDKGEKLEYIDNPVVAEADAVVGLRSALARMRLLESVLTDPQFPQLNTTKRSEAVARWGEGEFAETSLPQLKGRYMPKAIAWAFDDIVKTGFHHDNAALDKLAQWSQTLLKPFYLLGPEVHDFNVADKFLNGAPILGKQIPHLPKHFKNAVSSVWNQDATQARIMEAGGNPMYAHAATARLMPQIGKMVGEDLSIRPFKYDPLMKLFKVNSRDVFDQLLQKSNKPMWWQNDVLYTTMFNAFEAKGLNARAAVKETEKIIDSYVVPTTFGKTIGLGAEYGGWRADAGRFLQKGATDPLTANFGRFSWGLVHSAANMVKNLLGPNSTYSQRVAGAAQLLMVFVVMPEVYKGLSKLYQGVTGNPNSEFEERGLTRMANTPKAIYKGEKGTSAIAQRVWSPSVPIDTFRQMWEGKDFAGRPIYDTPGHFGEFAAGQAISPVRAISTGAEKGNALQGFVESNFGLKTPSDAAVKYKAKAPQRERQQYRQSERHPRGAIERGINRLIRP